MNDFSTAEASPPTVPTNLVTLLYQQGLSVPAPWRDSRSRPGTVAGYAANANEMDPLDLPPGDAYRVYARRDGRKRDPAKDGDGAKRHAPSHQGARRLFDGLDPSLLRVGLLGQAAAQLRQAGQRGAHPYLPGQLAKQEGLGALPERRRRRRHVGTDTQRRRR